MPKTFTAEQLRDKALAMISEHPEGIKAAEIRTALLGNTNDVDEERRRHQRLYHALRNLEKSRFIDEIARGTWAPSNGRPKPEVTDLPARRGRPGPKPGHKNAANGDLKSYIIRDIRAKLAELEAL